MADYYLAASLVALRAEVDRRWPNRDKGSDGWIGDTSHQARKSDHNPDYDSGGVVRAIDVDKDGITVAELLAAVVRDPRVAYVIWNRRIASATDDGMPWDWEPYNGTNPHDKHIHISIKHTRAAETNTADWFKAAPPEEDDDVISPEQMTELKTAMVTAAEAAGRRWALYEVLYGLETEDDRARARHAFEAALKAGQTEDQASAAAEAELRTLRESIKKAQAGG